MNSYFPNSSRSSIQKVFLYLFVLLIVGATISLAGWYPDMYLKGDLTSWNDSSLAQMAKDGAVFSLTLQKSNANANVYFRFRSSSDSWKDCGTHSGDRQISSLPGQMVEFYRNNTDNFYFSGTTNYYYTFTVSDPDSTTLNGFVQETTNTPVTIDTVSNDAGSQGTNDITVSITLSAPPSGELIFVRYSTNAWTSSSFVQASGSSSNYTATLSGMPNGSSNNYYVLTTTFASGSIPTDTGLKTIDYDNNGGGNFYYVVTASAPSPPTVLPASATNTYSFTAAWQTSSSATNYFLDVTTSTDFSSFINGYSSRSCGDTSNQSVTGLTAETTYRYRVRAQNNNGTSGNSSTQAVTTTALTLGNVWHIPTNTEPTGVTMRNPTTPAASNDVYFYNGVYTNDSNQSGGWLFYRKTGESWSSNSLGFNNQEGNNKYWYTNISAGTYANSDTIEYYFQTDFTDDDTTYIGTTNSGASYVKYGTQTNAAANPFSFTYAAVPFDPGSCWHYPTNAEPSGAHMRNPVDPGASQATSPAAGSSTAKLEPVHGSQTIWPMTRRRVKTSSGKQISQPMPTATAIPSNTSSKLISPTQTPPIWEPPTTKPM